MNLVELERKLLAAARAEAPSERVPYAFERRILQRLQETLVPDHWTLWSGALWRAAAWCVAIMLLLGMWASVTSLRTAQPPDLGQAFENAVLAAADQEPTAADSTW